MLILRFVNENLTFYSEIPLSFFRKYISLHSVLLFTDRDRIPLVDLMRSSFLRFLTLLCDLSKASIDIGIKGTPEFVYDFLAKLYLSISLIKAKQELCHETKGGFNLFSPILTFFNRDEEHLDRKEEGRFFNQVDEISLLEKMKVVLLDIFKVISSCIILPYRLKSRTIQGLYPFPYHCKRKYSRNNEFLLLQYGYHLLMEIVIILNWD